MYKRTVVKDNIYLQTGRCHGTTGGEGKRTSEHKEIKKSDIRKEIGT